MRRRRPQLQVALFPFLSVLLCTLGSLVFLLLVLDQKARSHRAEEAARQEAETAAEIAELQQRAQERLAAAEKLRQEWRQQAADAAARLAQETIRSHDAQVRVQAVQQLLEAEQKEAARLRTALAERRADLDPVQRRQSAGEAERRRLEEQVRQMELAVQQMQKAASTAPPPVYSLVPYRGRLGTGRRPIYLEGKENVLTFRPDGGKLFLTDILEPNRLAKEITSRSARVERGEPNEKPYLLLLLRPSAVPLYYGVIRALNDAAIDIGYEFIEEDWELDYSEPTPEALLAAEQASRGGGWPGGRRGPGGGAGPGTAAQGGGPGPGTAGPNQGQLQPRGMAGGPGGRPSGGVLPGGLPGAGSRVATGTAQRPGGGNSPAVSQGQGPAQGGAAQAQQTGQGGAGSAGQCPPQPGKPPQEEPGKQPANRSDQGTAAADRGGGKGRTPSPVGGVANRDWRIHIECTADKVTLHPQRVSIDIRQMERPDNPLLAAVNDLIVKRRAAVPDVRPQLRFLIRPDALRTYYVAASALDSLHLPSTAELLPVNAAVEVDSR